ncbi:hypothetical protein [Curvivirga aplysinae]|uniref:hypothetical protein n=1 Tax=Curvivirga aplysinae TaxID=2529852 RepID=UPI0012BD2F1B|nr:hypothetical protein [Curvivirga aplysinae]MTI09625.1 hypothetical protein [Curvivirga aplysinae]
MKKILIILIILLLLGGGGGAAYFFLFMGDDADTPPVPEELPPPPPPVFLDGMEGLTIPVIRNGQVVKFILINVAVELTEEQYVPLAQSYIPKLQDQFLRSTHAYFAGMPIEKPVNVRAIANRLKKIAKETLGTKVVKDVFVEGIFERKGS